MFLKSLVDRIAGLIQSIDEWRADDAVLLDVRRMCQVDGWSCGAQSALAILRYYGRGRSIQATIKALGTDHDGTSEEALLSLFRRRGLRTVTKPRSTLGDLRRAINADAPSIVSLDDQTHYGVVYGYARGKIFLADPALLKTIRVGLSIDSFLDRWDRWSMTVKAR